MHYNKFKKKIKQSLIFFRKFGSLHNLSFTNMEILRDKIIGVDKRRKKLLIVEDNKEKYDSKIIDLCDLKACKVRKIYNPINFIGFKKNRISEYLNSIVFQLDFKSGNAPVVLVFNKDINHSIHDMRELEYKTKNWEVILSGMLSCREQKSA